MAAASRSGIPENPQTRVKLISGAITVAISVANALGFLVAWKVFDPATPWESKMGGVLLAALCAFAQWEVIGLAVQARRALLQKQKRVFHATLAVMGVFVAFSMWGLENFWAVSQSARGIALPWHDPRNLFMSAVFAALAVAEPAMFWVLDAIKTHDETPASAAERDLPDLATPEPVSPPTPSTAAPEIVPPVPRETSVLDFPKKAAEAQKRAAEAAEALEPLVYLTQDEIGALSPAQLEAYARARLKDRIKPIQVARETGIPKTKLYGWRNEMFPPQSALG